MVLFPILEGVTLGPMKVWYPRGPPKQFFFLENILILLNCTLFEKHLVKSGYSGFLEGVTLAPEMSAPTPTPNSEFISPSLSARHVLPRRQQIYVDRRTQ